MPQGIILLCAQHRISLTLASPPLLCYIKYKGILKGEFLWQEFPEVAGYLPNEKN